MVEVDDSGRVKIVLKVVGTMVNAVVVFNVTVNGARLAPEAVVVRETVKVGLVQFVDGRIMLLEVGIDQFFDEKGGRSFTGGVDCVVSRDDTGVKVVDATDKVVAELMTCIDVGAVDVVNVEVVEPLVLDEVSTLTELGFDTAVEVTSAVTVIVALLLSPMGMMKMVVGTGFVTVTGASVLMTV